jgi:hypothetical protein
MESWQIHGRTMTLDKFAQNVRPDDKNNSIHLRATIPFGRKESESFRPRIVTPVPIWLASTYADASQYGLSHPY